MSWFKKIFSSQSSSQSFFQSSSQEPKVQFTKQKSQTEEPGKEPTDITVSEFQECYEITQSTQDSCCNWSGVSQSIDNKGKKREWSSDDEEEEPWWELFKSQSTQKSTQETSFQLSQQSSSQQTETSQSQQENHDNKQEDETEKISFYSKFEKNKKFKLM